MSVWYCYILRSHNPKFKNRTYNGMTNNPKRRIRQHNEEIKGGAKATRGKGEWEIYALLTGFPDKINCFQCEWRIKHPTNQRKRPSKYNRPKGRIKGLNEVLHSDKWTVNSTIPINEMNLTLWIIKEYTELLVDLPPNITVHSVDKIVLP